MEIRGGMSLPPPEASRKGFCRKINEVNLRQQQPAAAFAVDEFTVAGLSQQHWRYDQVAAAAGPFDHPGDSHHPQAVLQGGIER